MFASNVPWLVRCLVCWSLSLNVTASTLHGQAFTGVVRPLDPILAVTLLDTCRDSLTVRRLVDELERSDLIVHIVALPLQSRLRVDGELRFVVMAGGRRFVRIDVNERLAPDRRAAVLGHELQHAVEVARAPSAVDRASFENLYRHIGREWSGSLTLESYETDEAQEVGKRVLAEVRAAAAEARRAHRESISPVVRRATGSR